MHRIIVVLLLTISCGVFAELDWKLALDGAHRSENNKARDPYRHPKETLEFFGIKEGQTVIELSPGGGWYTEVLAPLTKKGNFYASHFGVNASSSYARRSLGRFLQKLGDDSEVFGHVVLTELPTSIESQISPAGTADLVVAFRNIHSWLRGGNLDNVLDATYVALKPGGTFGIVQHRSQETRTLDQMKSTGYVTEEFVISAAEAVGFKLEARSEINANSLDTADHPKGVWNLPPSYVDGVKYRPRYATIGESDRMTLRFVK